MFSMIAVYQHFANISLTCVSVLREILRCIFQSIVCRVDACVPVASAMV